MRIFLVTIISLFFFASCNAEKFDHPVQIKSAKTGKIHEFSMRIADDDQEHKTGLMFVKDLAQKQGMLFIFKEESIVGMWMKNTKIPLDMLFVDNEGKIIMIHQMAQPESLDVIYAPTYIKYVIEINGGVAEKLGIEEGDELIMTTF